MHLLQLLALSAAIAHAYGTPEPIHRRAPCLVSTSGYEAIDDAPNINEAIQNCGNGGTIVLTENYSVRSPIDLTPCRNCEIQLEGLILFSDDWSYWLNKRGFFIINGVNGLRLRSLTGKGVIDGHGKGFYQRSREPDPFYAQPILAPIISSTNVAIENLTLRNAPKEFFRVDAGSSRVRFSSLTLTAEDQWYQHEWSQHESIAFELRNSTNIEFDYITVRFRIRGGLSIYNDGRSGTCLYIDYSTSDITVRNIECDGTTGGVLVQLGAMDSRNCDAPLPPKEVQWANNILVSNYTANSTFNSGLYHFFDVAWLAHVTKLTYDGVNVVAGRSHANFLQSRTTCAYPDPLPPIAPNSTNVWFKNYRGYSGPRYNDCGLDVVTCINCWWGTCDFHFENYFT